MMRLLLSSVISIMSEASRVYVEHRKLSSREDEFFFKQRNSSLQHNDHADINYIYIIL